MESDDTRHFQRYFEVLRWWATPEELKRILTWITPDELIALQSAVGTPREAEYLIKALKDRSKDWEWSATARGKLAIVVKAVIVTGALVGAVQLIVQRLLDWWRG